MSDIQDMLQAEFPTHYRSGNILLLNAGCMEVMKHIRDGEFELSCVDPPYGIGVDGQKETSNKLRNPKQNRKHHEVKGWDANIPEFEYFRELERVSNNQIIWGANYFIQHLYKGTKGWIFWFKGQEGLTMSDGEIAYSTFDKPTRQVTFNRVELLKDGTIHPTQKPVKLYEWLLTNYAKKGDRILDTHLGSGSSAIAAHNLGFDFVGMELDKDYFDAAVARFNKHKAQGSLFEPNIPLRDSFMQTSIQMAAE